MKINDYGEMIWNQQDLMDLVMQGRDVMAMAQVCVDDDVDVSTLVQNVTDVGNIMTWRSATDPGLDRREFDQQQQSRWHMPQQYQDLDIAQHVLDLCGSQAELQRAAQELLMYQQRDMMDVLRYMKYLVDTLRDNQIIWGVGRGSSSASFVLYLLGVHRINSLEYDLDPGEFLR